MRRLLTAVGVVLVMLAPGVATAKAKAPSSSSSAVIVVLRAGRSADTVARSHAARFGLAVSHVYQRALSGYSASVRDDEMVALANDPDVAYVAPDDVVSAQEACPICTIAQITPRGVRRIGGNTSSARSGDGAGVVPVNVAVIDSGIQSDQPDLDVRGGVNCTTGQSFEDQNGHGTIVAGVIGARDDAFGVVGIAPGAHLWAVRVLNKQNAGSTSGVLCGIDWVTATRTDADPTNDIAVANMSLGLAQNGRSDDEQCGTVRRDPLHQAICRSVAAGVTYVAAAGNSAADLQSFFPVTYKELLTATAIADSDGASGAAGAPDPCLGYPDDTPAAFSNYATLPVDTVHTVAAPGVCISSTYIGSDVAVDSGTSFASPFVTGTVALCIASGPCAGLTPAQIVSKIASDAAAYNAANPGYGFTGDPAHPTPGKYYGWLVRAGLY